jgi:hypothetical protein
MEQRISSFREFWPYYLGEHRNATCRALHFIGTTAFFSFSGYMVYLDTRFLMALGAIFAVGFVGFTLVEKKRNAAPLMLAMIGIALAVPPHFYILAGILCAYAMAWIGHFRIEGNRPATFSYPLWSLIGDFKMWTKMASGQLWTGDSLDWLDSQGIPRP